MRTRTTATALAAIAITAGFTLSACSSAPDAAEPTATEVQTTESPALPADVNEADVTFTSGMIAHHEQAIEMSDIVLAKTGVDERVVALAEEIKAAQGPEIEQLRDWLAEWGVEEAAAAGEHGSHGSGGMISEEGIAALQAADGAAASKLFLEQMIEHHEGALVMAEPAVEDGENADVVALAQSVIDAQTAEIDHMRELLATM